MNETVVIPASTRTIVEGRTAKPLATDSWLIEPLRGKKREEKVLTVQQLFKVQVHTCL